MDFSYHDTNDLEDIKQWLLEIQGRLAAVEDDYKGTRELAADTNMNSAETLVALKATIRRQDKQIARLERMLTSGHRKHRSRGGS